MQTTSGIVFFKALHGRLKSQRDGTGGKLTVDPLFYFGGSAGLAKYRVGTSWRDGTGRYFSSQNSWRDGTIVFFFEAGRGGVFFFRGGTGRLYYFFEAGRDGVVVFFQRRDRAVVFFVRAETGIFFLAPGRGG